MQMADLCSCGDGVVGVRAGRSGQLSGSAEDRCHHAGGQGALWWVGEERASDLEYFLVRCYRLVLLSGVVVVVCPVLVHGAVNCLTVLPR